MSIRIHVHLGKNIHGTDLRAGDGIGYLYLTGDKTLPPNAPMTFADNTQIKQFQFKMKLSTSSSKIQSSKARFRGNRRNSLGYR